MKTKFLCVMFVLISSACDRTLTHQNDPIPCADSAASAAAGCGPDWAIYQKGDSHRLDSALTAVQIPLSVLDSSSTAAGYENAYLDFVHQQVLIRGYGDYQTTAHCEFSVSLTVDQAKQLAGLFQTQTVTRYDLQAPSQFSCLIAELPFRNFVLFEGGSAETVYLSGEQACLEPSSYYDLSSFEILSQVQGAVNLLLVGQPIPSCSQLNSPL